MGDVATCMLRANISPVATIVITYHLKPLFLYDTSKEDDSGASCFTYHPAVFLLQSAYYCEKDFIFNLT